MELGDSPARILAALVPVLLFVVQPISFASLTFAPATANLGTQPASPSQSAPPSRLVQTQEYNFQILVHKVTTATSYIYVTPGGNYSFSKILPWSMSYTSLWGNTTMLSTYAILESEGFLVPSISWATAGQASFTVNTTEMSGSDAHGYLFCSYNFSTTPEKTSCQYQEKNGVFADFSIGMITTGNHVVADRSSRSTSYKGATERTTGSLGLSRLGVYTGISLGGSDNASNWRDALKVDWSDYGNATVLYGKISFARGSFYGVVVQFPQNVGVIDPSIVQTKWLYTCTGYSTCSISFSSNPTNGDTIIVGIYCESIYWSYCAASAVSSVSETGTTLSRINAADLLGGSFVQWIYASSRCSSCGNTVTINLSGSTNRWWFNIVAYEVGGVNSSEYKTATAKCDATCGYEPVNMTTSSTSFNYLGSFAFVMADGFDGYQYNHCSAGSSSYTEDSGACLEYSTSLSSQPISPPHSTKFPIIAAGAGTLYTSSSEVGVVFSGPGSWQLGWNQYQSSGYYGIESNQNITGSVSEHAFADVSAFTDTSGIWHAIALFKDSAGGVHIEGEYMDASGYHQQDLHCNAVAGQHYTNRIRWSGPDGGFLYDSPYGSCTTVFLVQESGGHVINTGGQIDMFESSDFKPGDFQSLGAWGTFDSSLLYMDQNGNWYYPTVTYAYGNGWAVYTIGTHYSCVNPPKIWISSTYAPPPQSGSRDC